MSVQCRGSTDTIQAAQARPGVEQLGTAVGERRNFRPLAADFDDPEHGHDRQTFTATVTVYVLLNEGPNSGNAATQLGGAIIAGSATEVGCPEEQGGIRGKGCCGE